MAKQQQSRNFIPWNRDGTIVRRHLPIILKPLLVSLAAVLIWKFILRANDIHFSDKAAEPILFIILPLVGFMYVIFASVAVGSVFKQYRNVSKSVVKKDVDTFLLYRDEQLPIIMHLLVGVPSLFLTAAVMLFDYGTDILAGAMSIFTVSFMLVLVWVIATELDDFSKSIWFREKIPKHWYQIDIEEHFSSKQESAK